LEHYVGVLWQERDNVHHRRQSTEDHPRLSS
jgi:hypothetical protein